MKVIGLLENTTVSNDYIHKHGLSIYIETGDYKILLDTGCDASFAKNARKLGIRLEEVDLLILSHGHYDHGGGITTFLKHNQKAKIYMGEKALEPHFTKLLKTIKIDIGIKKGVFVEDRFVTVKDCVEPLDGVYIFGGVQGNRFLPDGNKRLLMKTNGKSTRDDFAHEINLLIEENGKSTLFSGCSHRGILNIMERAQELSKLPVMNVFGGFHLMGMKISKLKTQDFLNHLAMGLENYEGTKYYTCHCTGHEAYSYLQNKMKNLREFRTGSKVEI